MSWPDVYELSASRIDVLCKAIEHHSGGKVYGHATIQTCWDADRMDLGRVGIKPNVKFLSQEAVKHLDAAYRLSRSESTPLSFKLATSRQRHK